MTMINGNFSLTLAKAVLLHNGMDKPSIPVAHALNMKETYEAMKTRLEEIINYLKHNFNICAYIKIYITIIVGLQLGNSRQNACIFCVCGIIGKTVTTSRKKNLETV